MAQSPRRVDLRLTIPAAAPYDALAGELAGKFAEYAGAEPVAARELAGAVQAAMTPFAGRDPAASVELELSAQARELVVTARSGPTTTRSSCPLPD